MEVVCSSSSSEHTEELDELTTDDEGDSGVTGLLALTPAFAGVLLSVMRALSSWKFGEPKSLVRVSMPVMMIAID